MINYIYADLETAEQLCRQVTGLGWVSACASAGIQEFLHQPFAERFLPAGEHNSLPLGTPIKHLSSSHL